ncbi:MAG: DUF3300 domain-containing protein [Phycisphaerales bacterium]|nr:DUF3300 domain-containing protein [Phycisphaerales bacterium]
MTIACKNVMTAAVLAAIGFAGSQTGKAQVYPPTSAYIPITPAATAASPIILAAYQVDELTGPIALYPDPLLAALLPATTYPQDIAAAWAWLKRNPQPTDEAIAAMPWDRSVKALIRYPTVLQQLADNMEWTQALGAAFINQERDVMESIQRLRGKAQAQGNLSNNADQVVVADQGYIQVLPATPDYIYVPVYDPFVVYSYPSDIGFWRFGFGFFFNDFVCDWRHFHVRVGFDNRFWRDGRVIVRRNAGLNLATMSRPWVRDASRPLPVMPPRFVGGGPNHRGSVWGNPMPGRLPDRNHGFTAPPTRNAAPAFHSPQVPTQPRATTPPVRSLPPRFEPPPRSVPVPNVQSQPKMYNPSAPVFRSEPTPSFRSNPTPSVRSAPAPEPSFRGNGGGGSFERSGGGGGFSGAHGGGGGGGGGGRGGGGRR